MAEDRLGLLLEAEKRGILDEENKALLAEARSRGLIPKSTGFEEQEIVPPQKGFLQKVGASAKRELGEIAEYGPQLTKWAEEKFQEPLPTEPSPVGKFMTGQIGLRELDLEARKRQQVTSNLLAETTKHIAKHFWHPKKSLEEEPISTILDWSIVGGLTVGLGRKLVKRLVGVGVPEKEAVKAVESFQKASQKKAVKTSGGKATKEILGKISKTPTKTKQPVREFFHKTYTNWVNAFHPINRMIKNLGLENLPGSKHAGMLAESIAGIPGKVSEFLEFGTFKYGDFATTTGKSLKEILQPLTDAGKLDDFRAYISARHSLESMKLGKKVGWSKKTATKAHRELAVANPEFNQALLDLTKYQDELLNYLVDSGLLSKKAYATMRAAYPNYVPLYRQLDDAASGVRHGKKLTDVRSPIKKRRGSKKDIIDPLESIVKHSYVFIDAAERNRIARAIAELSDVPGASKYIIAMRHPSKPINFQIKEIYRQLKELGLELPDDVLHEFAHIYRPMVVPAKNTLVATIKGKRKYYKVSDDLYKSLTNLGEAEINTVAKILGVPAKMLRAGATLAPEFSVRNPIRDLLTATVFSKGIYTPYHWIRGMFHAIGRDEMYHLWARGGGRHAALVSLDRIGLQKNLDALLSKRDLLGITKNIITHPIEALRVISEAFESTTRLGEFDLMLRKTGKSVDNIIAASHAARDVTLNFPVMGTKVPGINRMIAFFNAQIKGYDKLIRTFREKPFVATSKALAYITAPSIALYMKNRSDPRWKEIPDWQKDIFWIVMTKDNIWRIPKPFELGVIFGSIPERILEWIDTKDPKALDKMAGAIRHGASPGYIPTFALPLIENYANKDLFMDRPLVPKSKEKLAQQYQSAHYTSETMKAIGKLARYSPAKLENLIRDYTGGLGRHALTASDWMLIHSGVAESKVEPSKTTADYPILKAFSVRYPSGQMQSIQDFYDELKEVKQAYLTIRDLRKSGRFQEAIEFQKQHPEAMKYDALNKVQDTFTKMYKRLDHIERSKTMTPEQKRKEIDTLFINMSKMARTVLERTK